MTIIIILFTIIFIALAFLVFFPEFLPGRIPILLYHRIIEDQLYEEKITGSEKIFTMPRKHFAEQMGYLKEEGYQFFHLEELLDILAGKKERPDKIALITFDDGFKSVFDHAYPILRENEIKATIFVTTDKRSTFFEKYRGMDEPLSDEQMRILHENGISIQSHGHSHRPLVGMGETEILRETEESKMRINEACGHDPKFMAIPGGFLNKKVQKILMKSGFDGICTSLTGTNSIRTSPFLLRRLIVEGTFNLKEFKKNLKPFNISMRRFISFFKKAPTKILSPPTWLLIRQKIYNSKLGNHLSFRKLKLFLLIICILLALLFIFLIISKSFF